MNKRSIDSNSDSVSKQSAVACQYCDRAVSIDRLNQHLIHAHSISNNTITVEAPVAIESKSEPVATAASVAIDSDPILIPCDYPNCSIICEWANYTEHYKTHTQKVAKSNMSNNNSSNSNSSINPNPKSAIEHPSPLLESKSIDPLIPIDNHYLAGIGGLIHSLLLSLSIEYESYLCDDFRFYYRSTADSGWGCCYRNLQTFTSSLLPHQIYNSALFNGCGYIPNINQLQSQIDYAHSQGFDSESIAELGSLVDTDTWAGTTEVYALLTSFGINTAIVDADIAANNNTNNKQHTALVDWIWQYFISRRKNRSVTASESQYYQQIHANSKSNSTATQSITDYFKPKISTSNNSNTNPNNNSNSNSNPVAAQSLLNPSFCPPLYFQHSGHSRSIVGIIRNRSTGIKSLLVLDPDRHSLRNGNKLISDLQLNNKLLALKSITLSLAQLKSKQYQLVYIDQYGLIDRYEQHRRKKVTARLLS